MSFPNAVCKRSNKEPTPKKSLQELSKYKNLCIKVGESSFKVIVIDDFENAEIACKDIYSLCKRYKVVGFDAEWKPTFKKFQRRNKVALLQIAPPEGDRVYLFRLNILKGMSPTLRRLLNDQEIVKAGVSPHTDRRNIGLDYKVLVKSILELRILYNTERGLAALSGQVLGVELSKDKKDCLSDWEQEILTNNQICYAAMDAYSAVEIFKKWAEIDLKNKTPKWIDVNEKIVGFLDKTKSEVYPKPKKIKPLKIRKSNRNFLHLTPAEKLLAKNLEKDTFWTDISMSYYLDAETRYYEKLAQMSKIKTEDIAQEETNVVRPQLPVKEVDDMQKRKEVDIVEKKKKFDVVQEAKKVDDVQKKAKVEVVKKEKEFDAIQDEKTLNEFQATVVDKDNKFLLSLPKSLAEELVKNGDAELIAYIVRLTPNSPDTTKAADVPPATKAIPAQNSTSVIVSHSSQDSTKKAKKAPASDILLASIENKPPKKAKKSEPTLNSSGDQTSSSNSQKKLSQKLLSMFPRAFDGVSFPVGGVISGPYTTETGLAESLKPEIPAPFKSQPVPGLRQSALNATDPMLFTGATSKLQTKPVPEPLKSATKAVQSTTPNPVPVSEPLKSALKAKSSVQPIVESLNSLMELEVEVPKKRKGRPRKHKEMDLENQVAAENASASALPRQLGSSNIPTVEPSTSQLKPDLKAVPTVQSVKPLVKAEDEDLATSKRSKRRSKTKESQVAAVAVPPKNASVQPRQLIAPKKSCVVCGASKAKNLQEKNVVPKSYFKHFPENLKDGNVIVLCATCNTKSNVYVQNLVNIVNYTAGIDIDGWVADNIDKDVQRALEINYRGYFRVEYEFLRESDTWDLKDRFHLSAGEAFVELYEENNIPMSEFRDLWRRAFIENMNPQNLPADW